MTDACVKGISPMDTCIEQGSCISQKCKVIGAQTQGRPSRWHQSCYNAPRFRIRTHCLLMRSKLTRLGGVPSLWIIEWTSSWIMGGAVACPISAPLPHWSTSRFYFQNQVDRHPVCPYRTCMELLRGFLCMTKAILLSYLVGKDIVGTNLQASSTYIVYVGILPLFNMLLLSLMHTFQYYRSLHSKFRYTFDPYDGWVRAYIFLLPPFWKAHLLA